MIDSVVFAIAAITGGASLTALIYDWGIDRSVSKGNVFNLIFSVILMFLVLFNVHIHLDLVVSWFQG